MRIQRTRFVPFTLVAGALLFFVHCGSDTGSTRSDSGSNGSADGGALDASAVDAADANTNAIDVGTLEVGTIDGTACAVAVESQPNGGHLHTAKDCDPVTYASNPPSSGTHYPDWAAFKTYTSTVPWGFLVHDLEHGAIVITYNCPTGCTSEVAQAQALIDSLGPDKNCGGARMKIVLAPAPDLDVRWAAAAWTWTLRADCFDRQAFASFIADHYEGPDTESECSQGLNRPAAGFCPSL